MHWSSAKRFCSPNPIALWVLFAHAHDAAEHSPILAIESPEKRCGKTTLLNIVGKLVPAPLQAANITVAAIYRSIEKYRPTLLLDEMDHHLPTLNPHGR